MAAGMTQAPFPSDQEGSLLDEQGSIHPNYTQNEWGYIVAGGQPLPPSNALWQGEATSTSCADNTNVFAAPPLDGAYLADYGPAAADDGAWVSPADATNAGLGWPGWQLSPTDTLSHNPWGPVDGQPFPSPMSEAPGYDFTVPSFSHPNRSPQNGTNSPATTANSTLPTPLLQPGELNPTTTTTTKKNPHFPPPNPSSKRPAESAPRPPRPRTLKRHRSDTPSIASIASISTTGSASTLGSAATTLGGVLPANVDPRVASEQICREARERSRAEALEMSQRRMMLLDHEQGALERETQRLQVNLSLMREAARREKAGLEEEEARAGRAEKWVDGG
ncbi:uncharacterized protein B0H64DRAFT_381615 [Chaetomium fimeti]|uniref:Uncharacterized protein n=1 Tax=Chaetomium fimeti TaxID=1854472 RepID=A0AAE0LWY6_9PEZI|nr:hypothetical protein B0H64DRAFT_381615 [Chaetomium fimeti]